MRLISKRARIWKEYNDFFSLFDMAGKIQKVFIASAYADVETVRKIFTHFSKQKGDKRGCQLLVFIDRAASQALPGQKNCRRYRLLDSHIKNSMFGQHSGIKVVGGKLFHSKMIYIKTTTEERLVVGSMNMTQNGTSKDENEELILYTDRPTTILEKDTISYFEYLNSPEISSWVHDITASQKQITFRDFFMNGSLYVRFSPASLFSFPLNLPENMRGAKASLHPLLDAEAKNSLSMVRFCEEIMALPFHNAVSETEHVKSERWTEYCIETLHGYWVPNFLCAKVDGILSEKENFGLSKIHNVFQAITTNSFEERIYNFFDELSNSILQQGEVWSSQNAQKRWLQWRERLLKRFLNEDSSKIDEEYAARLNLGVQKSNFFDIFNDSGHSNDFINSVVDFFYYNKDRKTRNKIINIVKHIGTSIETADDFLKLIRNDGRESFVSMLNDLNE